MKPIKINEIVNFRMFSNEVKSLKCYEVIEEGVDCYTYYFQEVDNGYNMYSMNNLDYYLKEGENGKKMGRK